MKATVFTVVSQVGKTPGVSPHFNWEQAKEMVDSRVVEFKATRMIYIIKKEKKASKLHYYIKKEERVTLVT